MGGCISCGHIAVFIDDRVFVFGEACSTVLLRFTVPAQVECLEWLPGGQILIIADKALRAHFLHLETGRIIFAKLVVTNNN